MLRLVHKALAEAIGTFGMVFLGCGAIISSNSHAIPTTIVPVVFGLVVTAMVYATGHISGAHLNPAVTLAFAVARHFPKHHVIAYWAAQLLGATAAISLLSAAFGPDGEVLCKTARGAVPASVFPREFWS